MAGKASYAELISGDWGSSGLIRGFTQIRGFRREDFRIVLLLKQVNAIC